MAGGFVYTAVDQGQLATAEIYGKALSDIIMKDPKVVAITADLAKSTKLGDVLKVCPERVINVGIAEQDMFGVAAGMARAGMIPFLSGFSAFTSMRACDQLHTDICYQNVNAKIIATHAGTSFGQAGSTHHAITDLAITRAMPNLTVIVPADGFETANAVNAAYENFGPYYIRINRGFDRVLYENQDYGFEVGKAVEVHEGTDITVIACGSCVFQAREAAKFLKNSDGLSVRVLNMHTISPIDVEAMGIDVLCFTGHKGLLGPQGTGGIYVNEKVKLPSFKVGGSGVHSFDKLHPQMMPTLLEAGTLNGHGIAGLKAALGFIEKVGVGNIHAHEMELCRYFVEGIKNVPHIKLYGDIFAKERAGIVSLNIGELDAGVVSDILWEEYGICVRAGAHCAPLVHKHFGTEGQGMVRFSFGYFNTLAEVDVAIKAIKEIAGQELK